MEFLLLGPIEIRLGERIVELGGAKQRGLLALLLLHANEVVSRDRLIDELWGGQPADTASHSLDHQISRLRKTLNRPGMLITRPGAYLLQVDPEQIDAWRFQRHVEDGRRANVEGRPAEAAESLRDALSMWRGEALADLAYESFAQPEIQRLEELRLLALEERIDADLALGRHEALVAELQALVAQEPLRERLRGQLMLALYRSGRQAEALRAYTDVRHQLAAELGLEPSAAMQQLERAILRRDESFAVAPAAGAARRRTRGLTAAALAIAATAGAVGLLLVHGGTQSSSAEPLVRPESMALVAAEDGEVVGEVAVPGAMLSRFGEGSLWNLSLTGVLTRIDPVSGKVAASLGTSVAVPCGLAVGEGSVWITECGSPTLVRVDPGFDPPVVAQRLALPTPNPEVATQIGEVAVGAGSVWVALGHANPSFVERLDSRTLRVQKTIVIPEGGARSLAFGEGALWVAGTVPGFLSRIDPGSNTLRATPRSIGRTICCVAVGGGFVWAATTPDHRLWKLDRAGRAVWSAELSGAVENIVYADGFLWASEGEAGAVVRVDPTTNTKRRFTLGHHLLGVAAKDGLVAVGVEESIQDVAASTSGRVVRVALKEDYLGATSTDPAATQTAFNPWQVQFQYATCAKLFNFADASGAAGARLVPEVAAGFPTRSDGGRTVTFRIRPGFRFSPPSNEPVTAGTFRGVIERALSGTLQPGPWNLALLSDVVGAAAYHAGTAPHVSGVSVRGNTLVVRLLRPAGDLAARFSDPRLCAVPADTPVALHGVPGPLPSAGPYYLAAHSGATFVLRRNPNYLGTRPQRLDAIVYRTGVDVGRATALVASGQIDYIQDYDSALGPGSVVAREAGARYRLTANNWPEGLALNPRRALFADPRRRRAVGSALDRGVLADAVGLAIPATHVLPPRFPGAAPRTPSRPDPRSARSVAGDRRVQAVFAVVTDVAGAVYDAELVRSVRRQLRVIGIDTRLLRYRQTDYDNPARLAAVLSRADIVRVSGNADMTRDPVAFLSSLTYLPDADRASLRRIAALASPARETAAVALAAKLERDAVIIGYAQRAAPELLSRRLGCVVEHPIYPGVDLAALCLRQRPR